MGNLFYLNEPLKGQKKHYTHSTEVPLRQIGRKNHEGFVSFSMIGDVV